MSAGNPVKFIKASAWVPTGVRTIPLTISGDVDLTDPTGQTGGYCARALLIGAASGNVEFIDVTDGDAQIVPVAANQLLEQAVMIIVASGTSVDVSAVL